jgi:hypothetical protein
MIKHSNLLMILCCFYVSLHASEQQKQTALSNAHVIYSHPYLEQSLILYNDNFKVKISGKDRVVTFYKNRTIEDSKGKAIRLGDNDETFISSSAQKFAWLGDSLSVPAYPDAPGKWSEAVLFTNTGGTCISK